MDLTVKRKWRHVRIGMHVWIWERELGLDTASRKCYVIVTITIWDSELSAGTVLQEVAHDKYTLHHTRLCLYAHTFPNKSFLSSLVAESCSEILYFESGTSSVWSLILPRGAPVYTWIGGSDSSVWVMRQPEHISELHREFHGLIRQLAIIHCASMSASSHLLVWGCAHTAGRPWPSRPVYTPVLQSSHACSSHLFYSCHQYPLPQTWVSEFLQNDTGAENACWTV